jgi:hypothetical protein
LKPIRKKRAELELNLEYIGQVLINGIAEARKIASNTLEEVHEAMNMKMGLQECANNALKWKESCFVSSAGRLCNP